MYAAWLHFITVPVGGLSEPGEWVLAERWRGVERPLPPDAPVLHVLAAWGDARHEVHSFFNSFLLLLFFMPCCLIIVILLQMKPEYL